MKIRQTSHIEGLYGVTIPAWALIGYQEPTKTKPARYVWVQDVRSCGYERFKIWAMNCATDEVYTYFGDVRRDSVARLLAKYADSLPLENIRKPEWERARDIRECGPKDRRPQVFDAPRKKPDNVRTMTDRSAVDGVKVGPVRYSEEGYYSAILKNGR